MQLSALTWLAMLCALAAVSGQATMVTRSLQLVQRVLDIPYTHCQGGVLTNNSLALQNTSQVSSCGGGYCSDGSRSLVHPANTVPKVAVVGERAAHLPTSNTTQVSGGRRTLSSKVFGKKILHRRKHRHGHKGG